VVSKVRAYALYLRRTWPRALIARERGCEPACLADEAGSQPAGTGGLYLCDSQRLTAPDVPDPGRSCALLADERTIPGLRQELCIDQRA
jgi:hypothetical protein